MEIHSFGNWLKRKRKALDLTQAELANQVGCSAAAIRKLEAEERRPSAQIAERLAEIFEIPRDERASFLRFARGELRSAPAETREDFPWQSSGKSPRSNLPAIVTSLVGREQEIALVHKYLLTPDIRLISLVGPPGIGKTRLSIEVARVSLTDFPDGVFFVPLAPLEDGSLLAPTIAQALGYVETKRQPAIEQLMDGIGDKYMLIVLDNCEHLIEDVASLASRLLSACSRLKLIATSRESLRIPGEWVYAIPALNVPKESSAVDMKTASEFPALGLFTERARAVRADFALGADNVQTIASICAQLDGLPLAIELMAARMRLMTPQALLEYLNSQFVLTADGMRSLSPRQKTLNDAIRWSYNLLSQEEQRLFACLSIFSGDFTLEMVEAIFSEMVASSPIPTLITSLLDKSLLQPVFDARGQTHFNMLVTMQAFALSCLQSMGLETDARRAHLSYFSNLAKQGDKEIRGPNQVQWLQHFSAIRDNLRGALDWAIQTTQTETALRFACRLDWFWFVRSDHSEGRQWLERVLKMPETSLHPETHAHVLTQLAHHIWLQIGAKEARSFAQKAISIARAHNDKHNTARALAILGLILAHEREFVEAKSALEKSKSLYHKLDDEWGYAHAMTCLGEVADFQGDLATALSLREQVLPLFRKLGDRYFESATLSYIGIVHVKLGNSTRGVAALRESLKLAQQLDSKYEIAMILRYFAMAAQAEGKYLRAVHLYRAAKNGYYSMGAWQQDIIAEIESDLAACRAALGASAFVEAVEQGRLMTMEQASEYALERQN